MVAPSYHGLHVETASIPRVRICDLVPIYTVTCSRVAGWEIWLDDDLIAGEFSDNGMRLDIDGHVIVDSL